MAPKKAASTPKDMCSGDEAANFFAVIGHKEGEPFDLNLTATVGRTIRVAFDADARLIEM